MPLKEIIPPLFGVTDTNVCSETNVLKSGGHLKEISFRINLSELFYNLQRNNNDVINYGKTSSYSHY